MQLAQQLYEGTHVEGVCVCVCVCARPRARVCVCACVCAGNIRSSAPRCLLTPPNSWLLAEWENGFWRQQNRGFVGAACRGLPGRVQARA
jgi:hypothetical protein